MIKKSAPLLLMLSLGSIIHTSNSTFEQDDIEMEMGSEAIPQDKAAQDFESRLKGYRALQGRRKDIIETIKRLKSRGMVPIFLAGLVGAIGGGVLAKAAGCDTPFIGGSSVGSGLNMVSVSLIARYLFGWGDVHSEYERERDLLEHSFVEEECAILKEGSLLDREYVRSMGKQEPNKKLAEILNTLLKN